MMVSQDQTFAPRCSLSSTHGNREPLVKVRSSCIGCSKSILRVETSPTSDASGRDVCRICQSETGAMVRPCSCDGSMGTIHERCLNQWYEHSGKDRCEICLTKYARTKRVFKPLRDWSRPKIGRSIFYKILAMICVSISLYKMILLFVQRHSYERFVLAGISPRTHDYGRIFIMIMLFGALMAVIVTMIIDVIFYIRKQHIVRFTEHEKHRSNKKKIVSLKF